MNIIPLTKAVARRALGLYRQHLVKDPFTIAAARWFKDSGDETLRLDYPLGPTSIVIDVGGYKGEWSAKIASRYDPHIFIFEPLPSFFAQLVGRFQINPKIKVFDCGISDHDGTVRIAELDDASSIHKSVGSGVQIQLRDINRVVSENAIHKIDLIKINIEGEEYPVLRRMLKCDIVPLCTDIQVQFHTFYPKAEFLRNEIRAELSKTHFVTYDYPFIWENWRKKPSSL